MATNNFKPYAPNATSGGTNLESQAAYETDDERYSGALYGAETRSALINKALRQANAIASAHAQAVSDVATVDMLDDGTTASLVSNIKSAWTQSAESAVSGLIGNTVCPLVGGLVPAANLPSYVDDVLEYSALSAFPTTGETGKIYVAIDTKLTYRWTGSVYVELSQDAITAQKFNTAKTVNIGGLITASASSDFTAGISLSADIPATSATLAGSELFPLKQGSAFYQTSLDAISTATLGLHAQAFVSGAGSQFRTAAAKLSDIVSVADFDTLAHAQTAAGIKPLFDETNGTWWNLNPTAPHYSEAGAILGRALAFDNLGATLTVGASQQYDMIGIRNGGNDIAFALSGASSIASMLAYYVNATSASVASSNLYGVIGNVTNYGAGTVKALYGRTIAGSGCTGNVIATVIRTELQTGSTAANAHCLQIGHAGSTSLALSSIIKIDTEAASGKAAYGILSDITIGYTTAFIRGCAGGGGKAFQWQASGGGADLFNVLETGCVTLAPATTGAKMLDLQNGARINFTATSASATAGTATLPSAPAQFVNIQIAGTEFKIPVYNN